MSKKFVGIILGVVILGTLLFQVVHISAQNNGNLDHVRIDPANAALVVGGTQQFSAQGYDANNVAIPNLTYTWASIAGGGLISPTGLFTAGTIPGTYTNTVEVIAFQGQKGLPDGYTADPEFLAEFFFGRNSLVGFEFSGKDPFSKDLFQLIVERNRFSF